MNLYAEILGNLIFGFAVLRAMHIFFEKRRTPLPVSVFTYLFSFVMIILQYFWIGTLTQLDFAILNAVVSMTVLFIISLNYKSSMIKRVAAICYMNFLFVAVNQILNLLPWSYLYNLVGNIAFPSITKIPIHLVITLFQLNFKNIKKSNADSPVFWVPALVMAATANLASIFQALNSPEIGNILITMFLFITSFIFFSLYDKLSLAYDDKLKAAIHAQEREYYFSQCQMMQDSVERMKSFRHDIKNHLAALKDFTEDNKAATDYLNNLIGEIEKSGTYSDTGNIAFDSIINYKLRNAKNDNVKLDIKLSIPPLLNVEVADVVTILGNLLDNALDAVAKTAEKRIMLTVKFDKGGLFIKVDNTYNGEFQYLDEKAGEVKRFASLKNGTEHGYGIKNIRQSLDKYNGYMKITHTNKVFSVIVFLYPDDKQINTIKNNSYL